MRIEIDPAVEDRTDEMADDAVVDRSEAELAQLRAEWNAEPGHP